MDAYLYVGPRDTLLREPRSAQALLDEDYLAEFDARATSIGAANGPASPGKIIAQESEESAFSYDPQ